MRALRRFLFAPMEYLLIFGLLVVTVQLFFDPLPVSAAWLLSLSPALTWLGVFCLLFAGVCFATWISTSSTEM